MLSHDRSCYGDHFRNCIVYLDDFFRRDSSISDNSWLCKGSRPLTMMWGNKLGRGDIIQLNI